METEAILDRRRLKRRLSTWRVAAIVAIVAALAALVGVRGVRSPFPDKPQIARVGIEGLITEDRDELAMLKRIAEAKHVHALILYVNSPGGTTTGGEALFTALRSIGAKKPVVAQFGTLATSAAYIAGLATDHIVARGNTITGSVGVIFQWAEVSQLLDKLGVKMNEIKSGELKANPSPFQPLDESGRQLAQQMVAESQRWFVSLVQDRRGIDPAGVPGLEAGRVYSGREALNYKLVDQIGGEDEALKWLEQQRGISQGLKVVDWKPKRDNSFGWLKIGGEALATMLGTAAQPFKDLFTTGPLRGSLQLDGLVSVWHPSEK